MLLGRERLELGFGALAIAGNGAVLALTTVSESPWTIDLRAKVGRMAVPAGAPMGLCGVAPQWLGARPAARQEAYQ